MKFVKAGDYFINMDYVQSFELEHSGKVDDEDKYNIVIHSHNEERSYLCLNKSRLLAIEIIENIIKSGSQIC